MKIKRNIYKMKKIKIIDEMKNEYLKMNIFLL